MKNNLFHLVLFVIVFCGLFVWLDRYASELLAADEYWGEYDIDSNSSETELDPLLAAMTLEQKVGQMLIIGFWGEQPTQHVVEMVRDRDIGGIILLKYNIASDQQLHDLISGLQSEAQASALSLPLFISVDQEGGPVVRVRTGDVGEFTPQGEIQDPSFAYAVGTRRGTELAEYGFNLINSPVLDCVNDEKSFLYQRVFRSDCRTAGSLGSAMVKGYQEAGLLAAIKHFPGHCDGCADSHTEIPVCDMSRSEFKEHMRSFEVALTSDPAFVMTAHVRFPAFDENNPSSLSESIIQGVLRDYLGYEGVVITDDMEMQALIKNYSVVEAAVQAVKAGNDMLIYLSTPERQLDAHQAIVGAVREGEISLAQIDASVNRIIKLKRRLLD